MKVQANVMVKNEEVILPHVYKQWCDYPIDKWVFYDDNSLDNTVGVIKSLFKDKSFVFEGKRAEFNESHNRSQMLEFSRNDGADFVLSIDADELLSTSWLENWEAVIQNSSQFDVEYYWYNVVGTVRKIRQDPMYRNNYRTFLLPMSKTGKFDMTQYKYHTPRTPPVDLEKATCKDVGVIHLQSINTRYYVLKQLWYKHYEYKTWNHSTAFINNRYDPVVNNLNFMEQDTPEYIYSGIEFDASVYDHMEETKGYKKFILENYTEELVTFGKEYL